MPLDFLLIFGAWVPNIAAFIVIGFVIKQKNGIKTLLHGWTKWKMHPGWYLLAFSPVLFGFITIGLFQVIHGYSPSAGLFNDPAIFFGLLVLITFTGAMGEELGWRGFALPRLQTKMSALRASILLGLIWALWHLPLWFAGMGFEEIPYGAYFNHGAPYKQSADGIEITFATNVFGPYLMTMLLRELLSHSDDARILHAGSNIIKHFLNPKKEIGFTYLRKEPESPHTHSVYINYRNSKMALLMLSFRMAKEFKKDQIRVYSLQINGATMSKEALMKVKPHWRIIARIQNLFFRPPEFMANLYYEICTAERFRNTTGVHFNHKLEIMKPAQTDQGIVTDVKQALGADVYPAYALREDVTEKIWDICKELTEPAINAEPGAG